MRLLAIFVAVGLCLAAQEKKAAAKQAPAKPKDGILDYDWVAVKDQKKSGATTAAASGKTGETSRKSKGVARANKQSAKQKQSGTPK